MTKTKSRDGTRLVLEGSREFSIYANETRSIPKVTDGLKDAMRKAMWVIKGVGGNIKTNALSGKMIEMSLYVHGDASDSINTLAAPFGNNMPLLVPHGNFGTRIAPSTFGASRYTEVGRPPYINDLFYTDFDIVPTEENFDGSNLQPSTFLPILPFLLVNGMTGVGTGWASTILPRDPIDVAEAVMNVIDGKPIKRLVPNYNWADTKCEFIGYSENRGGAQWRFTGSVTVKDTSTLVVTELPPEMTLESFREKLDKYEELKKIVSYVDGSSDRIHVTIKLKRGEAKDWTEEDAINFLGCRATRTENITVIGFGFGREKKINHYSYYGAMCHPARPGDMDPAERLIRDWVEWRFKWYVTRYEHYVARDETELALRLLIKACFDEDLPNELRGFNNKRELVDRIRDISRSLRVTTSADQHDHVASLPTYRWTKDNYKEVVDRINELEAAIAGHKAIIGDESARRAIFKDEVSEVKKKTIAAAIKTIENYRRSDD